MRHPRCPSMLTMMAVTGLIGFATRDVDQAQSSRTNAITVNGCLRSADQIAVGTSGSSERRAANDSSIKFVLTNATPADSAVATASATSGTRTDSPATAYRLDAEENALSPHVGHRVEITGKIENPGSTSPNADSVFGNAPRLKVAAVKSLGSTCTP